MSPPRHENDLVNYFCAALSIARTRPSSRGAPAGRPNETVGDSRAASEPAVCPAVSPASHRVDSTTLGRPSYLARHPRHAREALIATLSASSEGLSEAELVHASSPLVDAAHVLRHLHVRECVDKVARALRRRLARQALPPPASEAGLDHIDGATGAEPRLLLLPSSPPAHADPSVDEANTPAVHKDRAS